MSSSFREKAVAVLLLIWLVGGAFLYHLRFSRQFFVEQEGAIRALLGIE